MLPQPITLLNERPAPPVNASARSDLHEWVHRLDRLAYLLLSWQIDPGLLALMDKIAVVGGASTTHGINFRNLLAPARQPSSSGWRPHWWAWLSMQALVRLSQPDQFSAPVISELFGTFDTLGAGGQVNADTLRSLADRLELTPTELFALSRRVVSGTQVEKYQDPVALHHILELAIVVRRMHATDAQIGPTH
ncbi:MAG: hypothetical protein IPG76_00320 [Acidobacteria bacterium]|nr:hypothetical protein [Acidobacteriota bacterium]